MAPCTTVLVAGRTPAATSACMTSDVIVVLDVAAGCEPKPPSLLGPPPLPLPLAGVCSHFTASVTCEPLWWAAARPSTAQAVVSVAAVAVGGTAGE